MYITTFDFDKALFVTIVFHTQQANINDEKEEPNTIELGRGFYGKGIC